MPAEVKGGTEGGDRPPGPRGPWQFSEQGRKSLEGFKQGETGVWLTCLRTESRCSAENRSQGLQKGCCSAHSKGASGGREARSGQTLDFRLTQLGGGGRPPLPQRGRQGQRAVRSELQARHPSANSAADSCVRELAERAQAGLRSVWPSAQR